MYSFSLDFEFVNVLFFQIEVRLRVDSLVVEIVVLVV